MNISEEDLNVILDKHKKWYLRLDGGERAILTGADLAEANLIWADLTRANLTWANLSGSDLSGANLSRANLTWVNLTEANLTWADLTGADLTGANLTGADLTGANLTGANLSRANLTGANLTEVNLTEAKNLWIPMTCPDTGSFIGWKKAKLSTSVNYRVIVKLRICDDAKRSSSTGQKCRCDKAEVLEIQTLDGRKLENCSAVSGYDRSFRYVPGTIVSVPNFDENRWEECAAGIHFFTNRREAVDYIL